MRSKWLPWLGTATLLSLAGPLWANESADAPMMEFGAPLEAQALDQYRGRENSTLEMSWLENNGTVEDNRAIANVNGANIIRDGAFSHSSGLPITVQNSGNNVLIQNSVILKLDMQ
jgi:hypothetical protein